MTPLSRRRFLVATALGAGVGAAGCLDAARRTEWPMFRGGGDNRASTRETPGGDLEVGWERHVDDLFQTGDGPVLLSSATGDTETVYVTARFTLADDPVIGTVALDVATGDELWTSQRVTLDPVGDDELAQPPILWDDHVFAMGGREGHLLEREEGLPAFDVELPWRPSTIAGGDRALVALANGDEVAMVDLDEDEDVRWTRTTSAGEVVPINPLTVLEDSIYIPGEDALVQLRRSDGDDLWDGQIGADGHVASTPPLVDGNNLHLRLLPDDADQTLLALARSDRAEHWRDDLGDDDPAPLLVYRAGRIYALDGDRVLSYQVGDGEVDVDGTVDVTAPYPTVGGDDLFLLGDDELVVLDRHNASETGRVSLPGETATSPVEALPRDDAVIVTRQDRILGLQPT